MLRLVCYHCGRMENQLNPNCIGCERVRIARLEDEVKVLERALEMANAFGRGGCPWTCGRTSPEWCVAHGAGDYCGDYEKSVNGECWNHYFKERARKELEGES
jgi:hypothetical protein